MILCQKEYPKKISKKVLIFLHKLFFEFYFSFENSNISENNTISVEAAKVLLRNWD
jgi:hypothetical protein